MKPSSKVGAFGENIACSYLARRGYKIIERNFRKPWGEIDIVARAKDGCLVFVEVKTVRKTSLESLAPEEQMTISKIKKVRRTACLYAGYRTGLVSATGWRVDLVAITLENNVPSVAHYENI